MLTNRIIYFKFNSKRLYGNWMRFIFCQSSLEKHKIQGEQKKIGFLHWTCAEPFIEVSQTELKYMYVCKKRKWKLFSMDLHLTRSANTRQDTFKLNSEQYVCNTSPMRLPKTLTSFTKEFYTNKKICFALKLSNCLKLIIDSIPFHFTEYLYYHKIIC